MSSGFVFQMEDLGFSALYSLTKRLMASWRSITEWKTPCLSLCRMSLAKKPSTALSYEHEMGVKWKAQRGWRARHARMIDIIVIVDKIIPGFLSAKI